MHSRAKLALTRRQLLKLAGAASVALPLRRLAAQPPRLTNQGVVRPFLNLREFRDLEAATARIVPTDDLPGALEARVADYISGMLNAFPAADANCDGRRSAADFTAVAVELDSTDPACPAADVSGNGAVTPADARSLELTLFEATPIFAGGPFSGRHPFGDFSTGQPTNEFPRNAFDDFLPLNRIQRLAWTVRLDGADAVPEVAGNPLATELAEVDLRRKYRDGLGELDRLSDERFDANFVQLTAAQQDEVLAATSQAFRDMLTEHTIEGLLSDPVYGGNRDRVGWQLVGFDGDSQPLGYTLGFDEETQQYVERADKPNSGPNPDEDCSGFSTRMVSFLTVIATSEFTRPGARFRNPFCFEVPENGLEALRQWGPEAPRPADLDGAAASRASLPPGPKATS